MYGSITLRDIFYIGKAIIIIDIREKVVKDNVNGLSVPLYLVFCVKMLHHVGRSIFTVFFRVIVNSENSPQQPQLNTRQKYNLSFRRKTLPINFLIYTLPRLTSFAFQTNIYLPTTVHNFSTLLPFKIENYAGKKRKVLYKCWKTSVAEKRRKRKIFNSKLLCKKRNRNLQNFIICFAEESGTHQHEMMEKVLTRL
jgi:hypothetical protein